MIASVCERAGGRGGETGRAAKQAARQQSLDQSSTTAMVKETLRKNSVTLPTLPTATTTTHSHPNPSGPLSRGNFTDPSNLPSFDSSSFEKSDAQFEAEAELELLMMQEEMSDLRLGASETNWTQPSSGESSQSSSRLDAGLSSSNRLDGGGELERTNSLSSVGLELSPANRPLSREGGAMGGVATTVGVAVVRSQQLTVDCKEKERLEDIMAVAQ